MFKLINVALRLLETLEYPTETSLGRATRQAPKPPITPIVNISVKTFELSTDKPSPIQHTTLPAMTTGLNPYLFDNAPIIGPNKNESPLKRELAHEIVDSSESKYSINGFTKTPKDHPKPAKQKWGYI